MFKLNILILFFFVFGLTSNVKTEIKIKYKIGEEILTNIDIFDEKNYLIFLRPNLKNLSENELLKIAENSLIREIIKKKEINKIFKDTNNPQFTETIKKNLFKFKKVKNEDEFKILVKKNNINYYKIIEKIKYEGLWNELIFQKYNSFLKIDELFLKQQIISKNSKNKKYEYKLSEILFELEYSESKDEKFKKIKDYIKKNDFRSAASRYSLSNTANRGGDIGFVKETILSNDLNSILSKMKINEISNPIKYPNGYLILKINDKKEIKQVINIEKELKERVAFEKNKQLNQFSLLYYRKLKQNEVIDEF